MADEGRSEQSGEKICLGRITGVHGVRGLLTVHSFTETPEDFASFGTVETASGRKLDLVVRGAKKSGFIVAASGVDSREEAEKLKGEDLFAPRDLLPAAGDDEWYHADLVGLAVALSDETRLGTVVRVENFGAGDLLEIAPPSGPTIYLPFTQEFVPDVDLAGRRIIAAPPDGLFDQRSEDAGEIESRNG